jgi:hypothetical protein
MSRSKRRPEAHIIGEGAVRIIRALLPPHWTIREYHPDYGIDLAVELFEQSGTDKFGHPLYDTLGEHLFMQVKGCNGTEPIQLKVADRINVEIADPNVSSVENGNETVIPALSFQIDTQELVTVQRMGAAVPVLLTIVDVSSGRAFFVCLNDYIDKIILPFDEKYSEQGTKVIHVPERNEIVNSNEGFVALRFYAKRAKLMAAFAKFRYQQHELGYVDNEDLRNRAAYFARVLLRFDFWKSCEWWILIAHLHQALVAFSETGSPGLMKLNPEAVTNLDMDERSWTDSYSGYREYSRRELMEFQEIRQLWDQLANLGNVFEEICREWFLPTPLGLATS